MKEKKSERRQKWEEMEERGWVTPLSEPSPEFVEWWKDHDHARSAITVRGQKVWNGKMTSYAAWRIAGYRDEFRCRGHELASGTGVNYAYFGWWRNYPQLRTSNPEIFAEHREFCRRRNRPDPAIEEESVPQHIRDSKSFPAAKIVLRSLAANMDMNKAIGWTKADSETLEEHGERPF